MEQYIGKTKDLIDHISATREAINNHEHMLCVLGGLDANYTSYY